MEAVLHEYKLEIDDDFVRTEGEWERAKGLAEMPRGFAHSLRPKPCPTTPYGLCRTDDKDVYDMCLKFAAFLESCVRLLPDGSRWGKIIHLRGFTFACLFTLMDGMMGHPAVIVAQPMQLVGVPPRHPPAVYARASMTMPIEAMVGAKEVIEQRTLPITLR